VTPPPDGGGTDPGDGTGDEDDDGGVTWPFPDASSTGP
jgi:hypothetical protein